MEGLWEVTSALSIFLDHPHISTSGFASMPLRWLFLRYFCLYSLAIGTRWYRWTF